MKKLLPKSINNPRGFTLVELLVVISIIAILSVIGITVFTGVQKNARDSKRRADIDAISKALEVHYNTAANQYCTALAATYCVLEPGWFSAGAVPTDPLGGSYLSLPANNLSSTYHVCANLEVPVGGQYCKDSQQ